MASFSLGKWLRGGIKMVDDRFRLCRRNTGLPTREGDTGAVKRSSLSVLIVGKISPGFSAEDDDRDRSPLAGMSKVK